MNPEFLLASTLRVSTPLIFAAMGGLLSERAGITNIALEGMMLSGSFVGAVATYFSHSPWFGLFAAVGAGAVLAALYGALVEAGTTTH